jgi:hypothetical protein
VITSNCNSFTNSHTLQTPNAADSSASVFHGSGSRWLPSISQVNYALLSPCFLTRAILHAITAHEPLSLTGRDYTSRITITDQCSQSRSSLRCCIKSSNTGRSSTPGLTSSQAGGYLTRLSVATLWLTTTGTPPPPPGATVCDDLRRVCLPTANCRLATLD